MLISILVKTHWMMCSSQRTLIVAIPAPVSCTVFTSEKYLRKAQNLQGALQQENTKVIKQKQISSWHEILPNRLAGRWILHTVISTRSFAAPQFFNIIQIMYLSALQYVAKDGTHCSLPPNQEGRQALRKPLTAKKYWVRSTQRNKYAPSWQIHMSASIRRKWIFYFLPKPGLALTPFGVLCVQAGEKEANCVLAVVAMGTGRDKRPQKWRNKMTSKD